MRNRLTIGDYKEIFQEVIQEFKKLHADGKKYVYVEAIHKKLNNGKQFIGLFKGGYSSGEGHSMGWYGAECLRFTRCLAVNKDSYNIFLPKIYISTMLRMEVIRAKNDVEASKYFLK